MKADIIVNFDADNQYPSKYIKKLVEPIVSGEADVVIGSRDIKKIKNFSLLKKFLQKTGSTVLNFISRTEVKDVTSGFRAFSKEAAKTINIYDEYTYTLESLIQLGQTNFKIKDILIVANETHRKSRLVKSNFNYVYRSILTMTRAFLLYNPFKFFLFISLPFFLFGMFLNIRWLILYFFESSNRNHLPSIIIAAVSILISVFIFIFGINASLIATNRKLLQIIKDKL